MPLTNDELRRKYDRAARWYDLVEGVFEMLVFRRLRRRLLSGIQEPVLEVAAGTGQSFRHYPHNCRIIGVDLSYGMLEIASRHARRLHSQVRFAVMDAGNLAIPDGRFPTVVSSLGTCTFPDPIQALREMGRVCRNGGRILLIEHGRSSHERVGRWQDRTAESHARLLGCRWNQDPLALVRESGLEPVSAVRKLLGIVHVIEACPRRVE